MIEKSQLIDADIKNVQEEFIEEIDIAELDMISGGPNRPDAPPPTNRK